MDLLRLDGYIDLPEHENAGGFDHTAVLKADEGCTSPTRVPRQAPWTLSG